MCNKFPPLYEVWAKKLPKNITTHAADGLDCSGCRQKRTDTMRGY